MACDFVKTPDNGVMILCGPRKKRSCAVCKRPASRLCDYRLSSGRLCDAPLCSSCTVHVGANQDHCPGHPTKTQASVSL